jgi:26S proteasome non-ATPase regulatory subunit 9
MEVDAAAAAAGAPPAAAELRPFAVVDEVSDDSPASSAGVRVGDQLCRFGDVVWDGLGAASALLPSVAAVLQANRGREVETVLLRQGRSVSLRLVPREWAGRGLLGCHLRPL